VGAAESETLACEFYPDFPIQDLIGLPNYRIYLKLMIDGGSVNAVQRGDASRVMTSSKPAHGDHRGSSLARSVRVLVPRAGSSCCGRESRS
jgi:hypothetical protein